MSRLQPLDPAALEPEQRALFEAITGGRRAKDREAGSLFYEDGSLIGPFNPWLHHPPIGQRAQRLGEVLRYQGTLAPRLREVAILTVAAEWRSQFEWWAHRRIALEVGLSEETIAAIKAGRSPEDGTEDEQLVYHFAAALLENRRVSTATYRATAQRLGESHHRRARLLARLLRARVDDSQCIRGADARRRAPTLRGPRRRIVSIGVVFPQTEIGLDADGDIDLIRACREMWA